MVFFRINFNQSFFPLVGLPADKKIWDLLLQKESQLQFLLCKDFEDLVFSALLAHMVLLGKKSSKTSFIQSLPK